MHQAGDGLREDFTNRIVQLVEKWIKLQHTQSPDYRLVTQFSVNIALGPLCVFCPAPCILLYSVTVEPT